MPVTSVRKYRIIKVVSWRVNFPSDAPASFAGLLEVSQENCKMCMAEKAPPAPRSKSLWECAAVLCGVSVRKLIENGPLFTRNEPIRMDVLERVCAALRVDVVDVCSVLHN